MADNEKLNDMMLDEETSGSGIKKALLIVAIAIIILAVLLMVFWKSTRETPKDNFLQTDSSMQKIGNTKEEKKDDEFENLNLDFPNQQQEDKLDKVADDVKKQEGHTPNIFPTETSPTKMESKPKATDKKLEKFGKETDGRSELDFVEHNHAINKTKKHENKDKKQKTHAKETSKKEVKKEAHSKHVKQEKVVKKETKKEVKKEKVAPKQPKEENKKAEKPSSASVAKGYYLQVGVFANTPNKYFLQEFEKLPHAIEKLGTNKRYLIGPYKSREEALEQVGEITEKITKPVIVEVR
ncbi:SPOR domain-containing protein [Helicobacter cetorum]|uniref:SPOR domain-containing protein n=1 Tax=Helicobacter cetorum TaxID=138563 RepID=UPI000CF06FEE|nr:SPOR domain-containing protein [Helicobacter cetorum]